MSDDKVFDEVKSLLERYNPKNLPIERGTLLADDLSIDSVAAMDLIMEIEDRFEIDIPVNRVSEMRSVDDLVALTKEQLEEA